MKSPFVPPRFSRSTISEITIVRSTAFAMSYTVSNATETAVNASISTPVWAVVRDESLHPNTGQGFIEVNHDLYPGQRQRVAEGDQLGGPLGCLNSGQSCHRNDITFL